MTIDVSVAVRGISGVHVTPYAADGSIDRFASAYRKKLDDG